MPYADGKMLAEVAGGVGTIIINNPDKRNAMSVEMWQGLEAILAQFEADAAVRVVVITGAGPKAFASGADISQFDSQRADSAAQRDYDKLTSRGRDAFARFPRPTIARIRGFCLGGGLALAMQADLRIAAEDSEFGIPAARLGIAYSPKMVRQLVALVGPAHARMLLFTGARIDAREAERIGLVNRVVPDEDLTETVLDLAGMIASNAPLSLRAAKLAAAAALGEAETDAAEAAVAACFDSADYREGREAFAAKRGPLFSGR